MTVTATQVKELREKTGAAMMDCKQALVQANGDFEKACEWLRQKGINIASKKSSRAAMEGLVAGQIAKDGRSAILMEVNCETDFVALNEEFVALTRRLCEIALHSRAASVEKFLSASARDGSTVESILSEAISKTGENIVVRRVSYMELENKPGLFGLYVHSQGGKIGALIKIETSSPITDPTFGRDLAMHVVFAKPQYLSRKDIPQTVVENEKRIESGKSDLADKKPEIRDKIIAGRVDKIFAERCLLEQPFVKDGAISVNQYIQEQSNKLKTDIKVLDFSLIILGEISGPDNGKDA